MLYAAGPLLTEPEEPPPSLPREVADTCARYLPLAVSEQLVLVVDETILGSGKNALVITNERVARFDKNAVEVEISLARVHSIRLSADELGQALVFNDYRGSSTTVRLARVNDAEARAITLELGARLRAFPDPPVSDLWKCSRCGPGEVIHLSRVHAGPGDSDFLSTRTAIGGVEQFWFSAFVCRKCGRSELFLDRAQTLPIDRIAVATLVTSDTGPYR